MEKLILKPLPDSFAQSDDVTVRYGVDDNNNGYVEFLDVIGRRVLEINEQQTLDLAHLLLSAMQIFNEKNGDDYE